MIFFNFACVANRTFRPVFAVLSMRKIQTKSVLLKHGYTTLLSMNISSYLDMFKNRASQLHGGVCIYIKNLIPYKRLSDLEDPEFEVLWSHIRPPRLPRGPYCIIVGTIYHPPRSNDSAMLDYLINTLISLEGLYPGYRILFTGDFNHLKIQRIVPQSMIPHGSLRTLRN